MRFTLADGSPFDCPARTSIAKMLFVGNFETNEIAFVMGLLKRGDVVLDIGANAGVYTVLAGKLVGPQGHVYAFEPSKRELDVLRHNVEMNHLANVTIVERAVSNRAGTTRLAIARDGGLNSLANTHRPEQQIESWQEVETISLDQFLKEFSIPKVDFIKIDVEGAERLVFEGAATVLASKHPITILFEASDFNTRGFGYMVKDLLNQLLGWPVNLYVLGKSGRMYPITEIVPEYGNRIYNFVLKTAATQAG